MHNDILVLKMIEYLVIFFDNLSYFIINNVSRVMWRKL